ncbi:MAG: outer membrane protein assembly factor BamE [Gammaproteobacteria bacterium]|nr:outer membrane protein assembly factor BamE [Gammaproteobacteria bacterium]
MTTLALSLASAGCSRLPSISDLPIVHRIDVQQGNVVTQEMLGQLVPGMEKRQVLYVMGSPMIQDTFHDTRWDYLYTFKEGRGRPERRLITLYFDDKDLLDRVEGDVIPAQGRMVVDTRQDTTVEVPAARKQGVFGRLKDKMWFGDDDVPKAGIADGDVLTDDESDAEGEVAASDEDDATADTEVAAADPEAEEGEEVLVPEGAPPKKQGFLSRLFNRVGLGTDEREREQGDEYEPGDPRYRDPTDPDNQ